MAPLLEHSAAARASTPRQPAPRGRNPFAATGVERGADGVARYADRPASLVHLLRASVDRDAAASAVVEVGGDSLTYGELWDRAARVAGGLRAGGVERGDRVAIRLPNGIDWVLAFFGAQLAGAVVVPVNTRLTEDEAAYVVGDSGSVFTFAPGARLPDGDPFAVEDLEPDDLAAIFYTSGTTGFPKGAMTSHGNFTATSESTFRILEMARSEGPEIASLIMVRSFTSRAPTASSFPCSSSAAASCCSRAHWTSTASSELSARVCSTRLQRCRRSTTP